MKAYKVIGRINKALALEVVCLETADVAFFKPDKPLNEFKIGDVIELDKARLIKELKSNVSKGKAIYAKSLMTFQTIQDTAKENRALMVSIKDKIRSK